MEFAEILQHSFEMGVRGGLLTWGGGIVTLIAAIVMFEMRGI